MPIPLSVPVTPETFEEAAYLSANPDVRAAVAEGAFRSGRDHFERFGIREPRMMAGGAVDLGPARAAKMARLRPHLRADMACTWRGDKADFLTDALRAETGIADTDAVSAHGYDAIAASLIDEGGLVLDCGAGSRTVYYETVVNYEVVDYPSTDVLGVGEHLPFTDATFDGVLSLSVLEHVRDPFRCAAEIARVLKPGGRLYCCVPFLQPYHGYPHHYFNATPQGMRRLFEDLLDVDEPRVIDSTHPVHALAWILGAWSRALPPETAQAFERMSVADLMRPPAEQVVQPYCRGLPERTLLELACATVMTARKPSA